MNTIINLLVAIVVFWLIYTWILPLLPSPFYQVALVLFVLVLISWLLGFIKTP